MENLKGASLIKRRLAWIGEKPGVYRMLSETGEVLYVGKAKNLKKRLTNYTLIHKLSARIAQMVEQTRDLITIETPGEAEALILEADLIKKYHPYYNILLKDDKSYPYILITREETPRLTKHRGARSIKGDYFGPYASAGAVSKTLHELQKTFGLRTCSDSYFKNRTRPCLLYQIGRCTGPCTGCISKTDYQALAAQAKAFLNGEEAPFQKELTAAMQEASRNMDYEKALVLRDRIAALKHIQSTSEETLPRGSDLIALYREGTAACVLVFFYRTGRSEGNAVHLISHTQDQTAEEILTAFLMQFYERVPAPGKIFLSHAVSPATAEALSIKHNRSVTVLTPPFKGVRKKVMDQALENARQSYRQHIDSAAMKAEDWENLRRFLKIDRLDKVEIYDNSHIQGAFPVGVFVAATQAGFQKNLYRRFNIRAAQTNDDFAMMREVLARRLQRGLIENDLPSAFIIDGGKGQLSAVMDMMRAYHVPNPVVLAVAKGEERNAGKETFFLGSAPDEAITLDFKSDLIHFLQRLRDEAHRFAIGSHRLRRSNGTLRDSLDEIEGIGAKRKKELMLAFGSVREISGASVKQLTSVSGINEKIAKKIYTFYHG